MVTAPSEVSEFRGEFLAELEYALTQLLALAEAIPEKLYAWKPVDDARAFSAVLVHIAAGNFLLLYRIGKRTSAILDLYDFGEIGLHERMVAAVRRNIELERKMTQKAPVISLRKQSFTAVAEAFASASSEELATKGDFFGQPVTVYRVYLRMLAHSREHMEQAIAYTRIIGLKVPWPDPLSYLQQIAAART
jgi:hypothetical protein